MAEQTFKVDDIVYEELPACFVGDYGGYGTVGRANIDSIREDYFTVDVNDDILRSELSFFYEREAKKIREENFPVLVSVHGSFGYEALFMRNDHPQFEDMYERLESYPVYDEQKWSEQEQKDKESDWESWMEPDFKDTIRETFGDDDDGYEAWERRFDELGFGIWQVESWLGNEFNMYIEEDGPQSYHLDFKRLRNRLPDEDEIKEFMNEFLDDYS